MNRLSGLCVTLLIAAAAQAEASSVVYLPTRAVPDSLDPSELKVDSASYIFRQVAEGLFAIGEGFQVDARLAESAQWSGDRKRLTIKLRPTYFSDGSEVDSAAVVKSLKYCIAHAKKTLLVAVRAIDGFDAYSSGKTKTLSGIVIKSPREIEVQLVRQAPLLIDDLAQADCHIVKAAASGSMDLLKGAIGSGPYKIQAVTPTEIRLERTTQYYMKIAGPEVGVYRQTPDFGRFDSLKTWVTMMTEESGSTEESNPDSAFDRVPFSELGTHELIFNHTKAPFNREAVRKAVSLALNYSKLAETLGWSNETLQAGLVPLGMPGFRLRDLNTREADIQEAQRVLKVAGYSDKHPLQFTLLMSNLPAYLKEAALWPNLFSGVPIQLKVEQVDHAERNRRQDKGDFQMMRVMKYAGSVEAHRILSSYLSGSNYNPTRSREPECDHLTRRAIDMPDRDTRLKQYDLADRCLMKHAVLVPLASLQPGYVLLKKPWKLNRSNRYLLYPYWISEWRRDAEK